MRKNLMNDDTEFFLLNYNAANFCKTRLDDYGDKSIMARINIALHPYLYSQSQPGDEMKDNIVAEIFTTTRKGGFSEASNQNIVGIQECINDVGKININNNFFLTQSNITEVHLHPVDDGMAISPNNACFLLNMSAPVVNFVVVVKEIGGEFTTNRTSVFLMNVITQNESKCPLMTKVLESLQAINYLGPLSDIVSNLDKPKDEQKLDEEQLKQISSLKDPFNRASALLRH